MSDRIRHAGLRGKRMPAEQAAALIRPGMTVAMSGFTGAGYPKAMPAGPGRADRAGARPRRSSSASSVLTGASTAPELDGVLARADGMELRLPYQSDPALRDRINAGELDYIDMHLSHVAQHTWFGFFGTIDVAVIEVTAINEAGHLVPSSSVGNNKTWLEQADKVILEVNRWQPAALEGMHDIYYGTALPPHRKPIPLLHPDDRIGEPYLRCDPDKVVAVVETDAPDRNSPFAPPDAESQQIAGHLLDFLAPRDPARPPDAAAAAAAVGRRQHRQCRAGRPGRGRLPRPHRLHRGHPGRHAGPAQARRAAHGVGDLVLAEPGRHRRIPRQRRRLPPSASCCARRRSPTTPSWSAAWAASP